MKLNIVSKSSIGYIAIIIVTLIAAAFLYTATQKVRHQVDLVVDQSLPSLHHAGEVSLAISHLKILAFSLYGTTIDVDAFKSESDKEKTLIADMLLKLQRLNQNKGIQDLKANINSVYQELDQLLEVMNQSSIDWDKAREVLTQLSTTSEKANTTISQLRSSIDKTAQSNAAEVRDMLDSKAILLVVMVLLILAIIALAILFTKTLVVKPILSLSRDIDDITKNYDLGHSITQLANDEIGETGSQLNQLINAFKAVLIDVQNSANKTSDSSNTLSQITHASDHQIDAMTQRIESLINEMSQLQSHINDQVHRSEAAATSAQQGAEEVEGGAEKMRLTSESIEKLSLDVETASEQLLRLNETSNQVGQVVSTIAEIAEQTNLLALNAAIEAARAGESGRGFAVVADEVRTLATRTRQSTIEINEMLGALVQSISEVVGSMKAGKEQASKSVELGQLMVETLNEIRSTILNLSEESHQVAVETESAGNQVSNLSNDIEQFRTIGYAVSEDSRKIKHEADSLSQQGQHLLQSASKFKV